jgi:tetratricopeptide (TPR) repeat protein
VNIRPLLPYLAALHFTLSLPVLQGADTLQGAAAILRQASADAKAEAPKEPSAAEKLADELAAFPARAAKLPPAEAATEWLKFFDRAAELDPEESVRSRIRPGAQGTDSAALVAVLPAPEAWPELARQIDARPKRTGQSATRELGLRLLAHLLTQNRTAQLKVLAEQQATLAGSSDPMATMQLAGLDALQSAFFQFHGDTNAWLANFERQLSRWEKAEAQRYYGSLRVPDLVSLTDGAKADALLRRVLRLKAGEIAFGDYRHEAEATRQRARVLALEMLPDLSRPWWQLCESVEAAELFEAFDRKFPRKSATPGQAKDKAAELLKSLGDISDPEELRARMEALQQAAGGGMEFGDVRFGGGDDRSETARTYYLLSLILNGRTDDATRFARSLGGTYDREFPRGAVVALSRAGRTRELDEFLHGLLKADPALPYWNPYISAAAAAGRTDRMLALVREAAAQAAADEGRAAEFRNRLIKALLAADEVEAAAKELSASVGDEPARRPAARSPGRYEMPDSPLEHAFTLARLGAALERREWFDQGIAKVLAELKREDDGQNYRRTDSVTDCADLLLDAGRLAEAEALLGQELARWKKASGASPHSFADPTDAQTLLIALCRIYHRSNRQEDILTLLETAPWWTAADLNGLRGELSHEPSLAQGKSRRVEGDGLGYFAASALVKAGRPNEARGIVDVLLEQPGGYDPAYELLLMIEGKAALARLDALFAADPFEERPLIWKAELLRRDGKLAEAEAAARQAIKIDPSDGEQGAGRRMRVYAVLADIREARGDAKEAKFFRGVVRAIRMSEQADRLHEAGLLLRAVRLYQDSLKEFSDAYCIQSRLAVQLADLGFHEEALKHYQRAFELMPDSFGRIESHCFGCERTFASEAAQGVAERTFLRLAQQNPEKPQVHYLLGYLRSEQGRHREALPHYRNAVTRDPDYLNAWEKLAEVARQSGVASRDLDEAAFNILRLDPRGRHAQADVSMVSDLAGLWRASAATVQRRSPRPPVKLLPLPASKSELDRLDPERREMLEQMRESAETESGQTGALLVRQKLVRSALGMMDGTAGYYSEHDF